MKKFLTIMLVAITAVMLSSCVIVTSESIPARYDITCYNNTMKKITDWCVKKGEDVTYANSEYNCSINSGESDSIENLSPGYYSICISFKQKESLHPSDYEQTGEIYLDEDVIFDVAERTYYGRSVNNTTEIEYVLRCSNGKEYPLKSTN